MNQPTFWLQVTDDLIVNNFENLLPYLKNYHYSAENEHNNSDFNSSCLHLNAVAHNYAEIIDNCHIYSVPQFDVDNTFVIRVMAASLLASKKREISDLPLLASLLKFLLLLNPIIKIDSLNKITNILKNCIFNKKIDNFGFSWQDIEIFNLQIFQIHLLQLRFENPDTNPDDLWAYQGHGTLIATEKDFFASPFNLKDCTAKKLETELKSPVGVEIRNTKVKDRSTSELFDTINPLLGTFQSIHPNAKTTLKNYEPGDSMMVRVSNIFGIKVMAESIDAAYHRIAKNVMIPKQIEFIDKEYLLNILQPGDFLKVRLEEDHFILDDVCVRKFIEEYANFIKNSEDPEVLAIYDGDFKGGTGMRWISDTGMFISVHNRKLGELTPEELEEAKINRIPCRLRIETTALVNADTANAFQAVNGWIRESIPDEEFDINEAFDNFMSELIGYYADEAESIDTTRQIEYRDIPEYLIPTFSLIAYRAALDSQNHDTQTRTESLMTAIILLTLINDSDRTRKDIEFMNSILCYLRQIVAFASGASPAALSLPPRTVENNKTLDSRIQIVEELKNYRETVDLEPNLKTNLSTSRTGLPPVEDIKKLISASNNLVDKIDISEINRIKKAICTHLGVADEFRNITSDTTCYGVESDILEFKSSCVLPPTQIMTGIDDKDINLQQWNILKSVCAFLNSSSGGDLLIGVNDSGFAIGLGNDIEKLRKLGKTNITNIEKLRTSYLKLFIDKSFSTYDGSISGTAITADRIQYNIESDSKGVEFIRVKIAPYPFDVVKIVATNRPERFTDCYLRTSGASTPLDKSGALDIRAHKLTMIQGDDYKYKKILEAMDKRCQILIKNYKSASGTSNRTLEAYKIASDNKSFIAFDVEKKGVRMFRFSRFNNEDIYVTHNQWKNSARHPDLSTDIFGFLENEKKEKIDIDILLSDYAATLLAEETEIHKIPDAITPSSDVHFPLRLRIKLNGLQGIGRFVMGLPGEVQITNSPQLLEYIRLRSSK